MVKPEVDRLPTVPAAPPAAGPDRALDPPPPDPGPAAAGLLLAAAGLLLEVALTTPYAPPATAMAAAPTMTDLLNLREDIRWAPDELDPPYLRVAVGAGSELEATRTAAGRLSGTS
jgi:hypothetical protein